MPFIRYHIKLFKTLPYDWHWHVIEGVADLKYDTQWSVPRGGHIKNDFHYEGLSIDGTTEYLDQLKEDYPEHVTIYRKGEGKFWDGKVEMVNAPIKNLLDHCLLWEIDSDELWTLNSIEKMVNLFGKDEEKMGAFVYCHYFVGPKKFVVSMNTWATRETDWFRIFRFFKGFHWKQHEPPTLVDENGVDWGRDNHFTRDQTLQEGITFQHFAYVTEEQVRFKESYYGYKDAVKNWEKLQKSGHRLEVSNFLPWAQVGAIAESWVESRDGKLLYPGSWMV